MEVVEDYLGILEDLLLAVRIPVFRRRAFRRDYPMARPLVLYTGTRSYHDDGVAIRPIGDVLPRLADLLAG